MLGACCPTNARFAVGFDVGIFVSVTGFDVGICVGDKVGLRVGDKVGHVPVREMDIPDA